MQQLVKKLAENNPLPEIKNKDRFYDMCGYAAIGLIQGATMPSMLSYIITGSGELPPLTMTLMIWAGLFLYLVRSFYRKDMVAIISNSIGFVLQSIMLAIITLA